MIIPKSIEELAGYAEKGKNVFFLRVRFFLKKNEKCIIRGSK